MKRPIGKFRFIVDADKQSPEPAKYMNVQRSQYGSQTWSIACPVIPDTIHDVNECRLSAVSILKCMERMGFGDGFQGKVLLMAPNQEIRWVTGIDVVTARRPFDGKIIEKWQLRSNIDSSEGFNCSDLRKRLGEIPLLKVSMFGITPKPYLNWVGRFEPTSNPCLIFGGYVRSDGHSKPLSFTEDW